MNWLPAFRRNAFLRWLALAIFSLSLGAAAASPMVHPQALELVCSSAGMVKLIVHADDGQVFEHAGMGADCPLCVSGGAPPPVAAALKIALPLPLGRALQSIPAARLAAATAAPFPARGPPARA